MKCVIAGSRSISDPKDVSEAIVESGFTITEIVSGGARGVDTLGEHWAVDHSLPFTRFSPDWKLYGKAAGPVRNNEMALAGGCLIAIWDGESRGTKHMIEAMQKLGKPVYVKIVANRAQD